MYMYMYNTYNKGTEVIHMKLKVIMLIHCYSYRYSIAENILVSD